MNWLLFLVAGSVWLFAIWGFSVFLAARAKNLEGWPEYWLAALFTGIAAPVITVIMIQSGIITAQNILTETFNAQAGMRNLIADAGLQTGISIIGVVVGWVYLLGAVLFLLKLTWQLMFLSRARQAGTRRVDVGYEIIETNQACPPCSTGIFRPAILMPTHLREQLSTNQRKMIYAHETAHIRHRDPQVMLALYILKALMWPYPPVHDMVRRWLDAAEMRADNTVLQDADKNLRESYGRLLLEVLRKYSPQTGKGGTLPCPSATLNLEHLRSAKMRVNNIMNQTTGPFKTKRLKIQLAVLTGAAVLLGSYGLIATAGESVSPDKDAQPMVRYPPIFPANCEANPGEYAAKVIVKFDVDKQGNVENIQVTKSDNPCFNETTKDSVAKWKYAPVLENAKPRKRKNVQAMITYRLG